MDKLTLEHLAHYLPYGLQIKSQGYTNLKTMDGLTDDCVYFKGGGFTSFGLLQPVLKPLSDFQSQDLIDLFEIAYKDVYGHISNDLKDFIFQGWNSNHFRLIVRENEDVYGFSLHLEDEQDIKFSYRPIDSDLANSMFRINKYNIFQELFRKHFDVFGLIDKGLAIDINSITGHIE